MVEQEGVMEGTGSKETQVPCSHSPCLGADSEPGSRVSVSINTSHPDTPLMQQVQLGQPPPSHFTGQDTEAQGHKGGVQWSQMETMEPGPRVCAQNA